MTPLDENKPSRSLMTVHMLAFGAVSLLAIAIIALTAFISSRIEMTRFVNDLRYQNLVDSLGNHFAMHGTLQGSEMLLLGANKSGSSKGHEFLVVDPNGLVVASMVPSLPAGMANPEIIRFGLPIFSGGQLAGYLVPLRPTSQPYGDINQSIARVQRNMLIGVGVSALVALAIGWLVSLSIILPIRRLKDAARRVADGDLEAVARVESGNEIGQLAATFNQMTNNLRRNRDLRRQMIADIAHELRNPLTIILGNAEAISEGVLPPTRQAIEVVHDEARHLAVIVDDLRTLSLSEDGELVLQPSRLDLADLLERLPIAFSVAFAQKGATLRVNCPPRGQLPLVFADADRMLQVLSNLVSNSLKHVGENGQVWVTAVSEGETVRVDVNDNGAGIAGEDLPYIFERFYRTRKGANRLEDGTGLGLAICRSLIANHGGSIWVESEPGVRTTFAIRLMAMPGQGKSNNAKAGPARPAGR